MWQIGTPSSYFGSSAAPHTETCLVDCVCRPWSPQLECQSVPVEQSTRQTQPRESKAQAPGQEIALENTPLWQRINSVLIGEKAWGEGGKKRDTSSASSKGRLCCDCRNQGRVSLSPH